jgi:glycosyltransferase involved in cell wall biosynthesis
MSDIKKYLKKYYFFLAKIMRKISSFLYYFSLKHHHIFNLHIQTYLKSTYHVLDRWVDITRDVYYAEESKNIVENICLNRKKQLFFDVTTLRLRDDKTGIQRVVRSIFQQWVEQPPQGFDVQPVYACYGRYHYARDFFDNFLGHCIENAKEGCIDYQVGDIFLSADLNYEAAFSCEAFYQRMRHSGAKVFFVVHDLLCMTMPAYFFDFAAEKHERWLKIVASCDGALCVSRTVANEVSAWVSKHVPHDEETFYISWFHLGADLQHSAPTIGMPAAAEQMLHKIKLCPSFLMVGRLEPRKGHMQVIKAFELLWQKNVEINLVIVGKQGWRVDALIKTLRRHPRLQKNLYWFENATDEFLEKIYSACTCLIAASEGEGFGLPLIEAASYGLPLMTRDLAVFHEVTQEHAFFFEGLSPEALAEAIDVWLTLFKKQQHPLSTEMTYLTWSQSAQQLLFAMLHNPESLP